MVTSYFIFHEYTHMRQMDWKFDEYCFFGSRDRAIGWVVPSENVTSEVIEVWEEEADSYTIIYILIMFVLLEVYVWKLIGMWKGIKK